MLHGTGLGPATRSAYFGMQDFMRLYQAELLMETKAEGKYPPPRLTDWIRGYAINAAKDKACLPYTLDFQEKACDFALQLD